MIQALQKQAEKLEETAKRIGEVKIPEEVRVYNHVRHSTEPVTLKFRWIFFSVSLLNGFRIIPVMLTTLIQDVVPSMLTIQKMV
ncbi:MAG: hypothetical protein WKF97_16360 [Chitinophagaceae bacterium]